MRARKSSIEDLRSGFMSRCRYLLRSSERSEAPAKGVQMSDLAVAATEAVDPKILLSVLAQVKGGDFSARMAPDWTGLPGKVARATASTTAC